MEEVLTQKQKIPFTQIANAVLNDKKISWKAKGLFSYLFSKPKGWDFSGDRISNDSLDGRDATFSGLKELEEAGYLIRTRLPSGRVEYALAWSKPFEENPKKGKSLMGKSRMLSNTESESNKEVNTNAPVGAVRIDSFFNSLKRKERTDDGVPMDLPAFVLLARGSQYRHIRLIGEYADERKLTFETRGQWREFGRRNLRAARRLAPFSDRQIEKAMAKLEADRKERGGFISKWTLETLEKYLEEI